MSGLSAAALTGILARCNGARPRVFCETGTFRGERAALATDYFAVVCTVDLSDRLFQQARERWVGWPISFVHGDSRDVVPQWAQAFTEPVCWFLDAHWFELSPRKTRAASAQQTLIAGADRPLPLWDELAAISRRPYRDLVIVDDVRDFGTERPVPAWREVTLERIADYFPDRREARILGDQAVVWR